MGFTELLLTGIGLSMDAFAVSICKGLKMRRLNIGQTLVIALFFGGFQALMPLIGWFFGKQFESYITGIDHWIVFALLAFIGGKMIYDALHEEDEAPDNGFDIKELFLLAIATSIDALAVGISFALLGMSIWEPITIIGTTTFILSALGVFVGHKFGARYKQKAELVGGVILILIGLKILLEHLGILAT